MVENLSPGERALDHVKHLAGIIGGRPAGSSQESVAFTYIQEQMEKWGYTTTIQTFPFAPLPKFDLLYPLTGILLSLSGWTFPIIPWATIWIPLWIFACPQIARFITSNRKCTKSSKNYIFLPPGNGEAIHLFLSAHVDTAPASGIQGSILRKLYGKTMFWVQRAALLVSFCSFVSLFGVRIEGALHLVIGILVSIQGLWLAFTEFRSQYGIEGKYSPGANDNASGVAVLLVAGEFLKNRPESANVGWIFTGAEETGLHGAIKAAQWIKENMPGASLISLDMVGSGSDLRVAVKDGTIFPVYPDRELIKFVKKTLPGVRDLWYTLRSGDFAMFAKRGISATGLQMLGGKKTHLKYHGIDDLPDSVEPEVLERMVWNVISLVQARNQEIGK